MSVTAWLIGGALLYVGAIVLLVLVWDELVDLMSGLARRGHRKAHDVERTRKLHMQRARASARARVPQQRGAKHRRE